VKLTFRTSFKNYHKLFLFSTIVQVSNYFNYSGKKLKVLFLATTIFFFNYESLFMQERVTNSRVAAASLTAWILSVLTGFVPDFTGIYSSPEHLALSRSCNEIII